MNRISLVSDLFAGHEDSQGADASEQFLSQLLHSHKMSWFVWASEQRVGAETSFFPLLLSEDKTARESCCSARQ